MKKLSQYDSQLVGPACVAGKKGDHKASIVVDDKDRAV